MTGPKAQEDIARIVDKLCDDYKSHAYQIPRREAKAIGLKVVYAPKRLEQLVMRLYRHYLARPMLPPSLPGAGITFASHIAWLDFVDMQLRCVAEQQLQPDGRSASAGDRWTTY